MQKSRKRLLECLDRALALDCSRVYFSKIAPLPPGEWQMTQKRSTVRLLIPLSGMHSLHIHHQDAWRRIDCHAGEAMVFLPMSWTAATGRPLESENLGIVLLHDCLRLVNTRHERSDTGPKFDPDYFFHVHTALRSSTAAMLNLLAEIGRAGDLEGLAPRLIAPALKLMRTDLSHADEDNLSRPDLLWHEIYIHLAENFHRNPNREEIARLFGISTVYLSKLFRQYGNGLSFNRTLNQMRLSAAENLLLESDLNCEEIARKCGYADPSYFGARFRRRFRCTPLDYRRRHSDTNERSVIDHDA